MIDQTTCYQFTLAVGGVDQVSEELENALFDAGCDDALLSSAGGHVYLEFDREAKSLHDAIISAIHAVEGSKKGLKVLRVHPPNAQELDRINAALKVRNEAEANHLLQELQAS